MLKNNIVLDIFQKELVILWHSLNPYYLALSRQLEIYIPSLLLLSRILILLGVVYLIVKTYLWWKESTKPSTIFEITPPTSTNQSSFTTAQLFASVHGVLQQRSPLLKFFDLHRSCSFEIVSTKEKGIRYLVKVSDEDAAVLKKNLISYLPGINVTETSDYIDGSLNQGHVLNTRLSNHFVYPLKQLTQLEEYDPIAYITGTMTKLKPNELVAVQLNLSPIGRRNVRLVSKLHHELLNNKDVLSELSGENQLKFALTILFRLCIQILMLPIGLLVCAVTGGREGPLLSIKSFKPKFEVNTYKSLIETQIEQKIGQQLFSTSFRFLTVSESSLNRVTIEKGLVAALSPFTNANSQSLIPNKLTNSKVFQKASNWLYRHRLLNLTGNMILSTSEISDLYHFPFSATTQTEDLSKVYSKELPAPLSLKNNRDLDVIFAKNHFGNSVIDIGLTDDDRSRHMYAIGQTGSGKTTIMYHMASQDIAKGRGVAVIDPHGDLSEDLLSAIPLSRIDDFIYLNPFDIKYPLGINLLELTPDLSEDDLELEKELVCEGVISVFRRIFSKDENSDSHRIEYILRNTIHTAFIVPDHTIFTVYDLLNDPPFRESVVSKLKDENLRLFWQNEFGSAGDYQVVKMVSGVTAKVGRFLFSPTAKRILEQPHSTINFNEILNSGKILICNLSEGRLGEDTSQLLGTTIISKIQQAAVRRSRIELADRKPFYLFVDEFQNFAMSSFTKLLSGSRKFGLRVMIAEQSTSQQADRHIVDVILANTGTVACFRTASPIDEQLMLNQFAPKVTEGEIMNLARYHFYIKLSALEPQDPFSGITIPVPTIRDYEKINALITASRKNYCIEYQRKTKVSKSPVNSHVEEIKTPIEELTIGTLS